MCRKKKTGRIFPIVAKEQAEEHQLMSRGIVHRQSDGSEVSVRPTTSAMWSPVNCQIVTLKSVRLIFGIQKSHGDQVKEVVVERLFKQKEVV